MRSLELQWKEKGSFKEVHFEHKNRDVTDKFISKAMQPISPRILHYFWFGFKNSHEPISLHLEQGSVRDITVLLPFSSLDLTHSSTERY